MARLPRNARNAPDLSRFVQAAQPTVYPNVKRERFRKIPPNWRYETAQIRRDRTQEIAEPYPRRDFRPTGFHASTTPGSSLLSSARTLLKLTRSLARLSIDSTV
jgi:hypothetical protein